MWGSNSFVLGVVKSFDFEIGIQAKLAKRFYMYRGNTVFIVLYHTYTNPLFCLYRVRAHSWMDGKAVERVSSVTRLYCSLSVLISASYTFVIVLDFSGRIQWPDTPTCGKCANHIFCFSWNCIIWNSSTTGWINVSRLTSLIREMLVTLWLYGRYMAYSIIKFFENQQ